MCKSFNKILEKTGKYCNITGKGFLSGNNVSHAHNISNRTFEVNMRKLSVHSDVMGKINLLVSSNGLRTLKKHGGLDNFLRNSRKLTPECKKLKDRLDIMSARVTTNEFALS